MIHPCDGRTDAQKGGRAITYSAMDMLSRAKNQINSGFHRPSTTHSLLPRAAKT